MDLSLLFEGTAITVIIGFQVYLAIQLNRKIQEYKDIFNIDELPVVTQKYIIQELFDKGDVNEILNFDEESADTTVKITYLQNRSKRKVLPLIVKYLNIYLIKNKGAAVDFHIIKDIVEKHTETIEDQIENRVPAPLYLGLAATMLGIIFGLFSVDFSGDVTNVDAIQPLINGVKIAMIASVIGLGLTTYFSIKKYKDAQTEVDEEKSEFLSMLQAELMPKMAIGKLPEVSILSAKLDTFARNTTSTVSQLDKIVSSSVNTVQQEQRLINEIQNLDIRKLTGANVRVFNRLGDMMDSFNNFASYYETLNRSLTGTTELLKNLQEFVNSTKTVTSLLEEIKNNIETSNSATQFFNAHIRSFEQYGESVRIAIADNDEAFRTAVEQLSSATHAQYDAFSTLISEFDSKLSGAFTKSVEKFTETMDEQVRRTEEAFERSRPKFEKLSNLDKLDKLENIETRLEQLEDKLSENIIDGNQNIVSSLTDIKQTIINIQKSKKTDLPDIEIGIPTSTNPKNKKWILFNYDIALKGLKVGAYLTIIIYGLTQLFN
jgi:hypothetical protein